MDASFLAGAAAAWGLLMMVFGRFFRCALMLSVRPPSPIDVKKLMEKRVFLGRSFGKTPSNHPAEVALGSCSRSFSFRRPNSSARSWKRILMKILEDDVVSSSVILITPNTDHGSPSVSRRCAKSLATFRSLLVSSLWMVSYCL